MAKNFGIQRKTKNGTWNTVDRVEDIEDAVTEAKCLSVIKGVNTRVIWLTVNYGEVVGEYNYGNEVVV